MLTRNDYAPHELAALIADLDTLAVPEFSPLYELPGELDDTPTTDYDGVNREHYTDTLGGE